MGDKRKSGVPGPLATNRRAMRNYTVLEKFEAGIALLGSEVKSIRNRNVDLSAAFARIENGEAMLHEMHIKPYEAGGAFNPDPRRTRRLLLRKREIMKLYGQTTVKGKTIVPISLFLNPRGKVKVSLALCLGRHSRDRRNELRRKAIDRETREAVARHRRR